MKITIFGFIWMMLILICIYKKNIKNIITLTLFSMIFQCNNVIILSSGIGVGPQIITSFIFICFSFLIKTNVGLKISISKSNIKLVFPWILIILIIVFSSSRNNVFEINLLRIFQLIIYIICFARLLKISKYIDYDLKKNFRAIVWFVVICGLIQYLMSIGLIPKFKIFSQLIYNESNNPVVFFYNPNVKRLFSTFMEASYCAPFLVGSFYYFLYDYINYNDKDNRLLMVILVVEILLTFSATAYVIFILCGVLMLLLSKQKKAIKYEIVLFLMATFFIILFGNKIIELVNQKLSSGSGVARNSWNVWSIRDFQSSPIYGVGYKNSRASSLIITILAELGILGLSSYICAILIIFFRLLKNKLSFCHLRKYLLILISVIIAQYISIPDLDFTVFWLSMYLIAIAYQKKV